MNIRLKTITITLILLVSATVAPRNSYAQTAQQVANSVEQLQHWLAGQEYEEGWNNYLKLGDLNKQIAAGDKADKPAVKKILNLFQSGANGLQLEQFSAVEKDLSAWYVVLSAPTAAELAAASTKAKNDAKVPSAERLKTALSALIQSMAPVEPLLDNNKIGEETWREFLQWKDLKTVLAEKQPDLAVLKQFVTLMQEDHEGFEDARFLAFRYHLQQYVNLASFAATKNAKAVVQKQLDSLSTELKRYQQNRKGEDARLIGLRLGYLRRSGQVPSFVQAVRYHYCKPNLYLNVSDRFLGAAAKRKIDDHAPVRQNILGTDISGTGHTVGFAGIKLVPNQNQAVFLATMTGTNTSENIGYNGPVVIYSNSVAQLNASKRLVLNGDEFNLYPTSACASVNSNITDIVARRCIIEKIAWKRAGRQQGQAEEIAAELAEERLIARFDKEATPQLLDTQKRYQDNMRAPLLRRDAYPSQIRFSTTANQMRLLTMQATDSQLAAPDVPAPPKSKADISLQLHESWVNNLASSVLAGETITQEGLQKFFKERTGEVPKELVTKKDQEPWGITFAPKDPVLIRFAANTFTVTIKGREYSSGERTFGAMNVTATYKIQNGGKGIKLIRQGELVIVPPNFKPGKQLTPGQVNLRTILRKRLGDVLKPEITPEPLKMDKLKYVEHLLLKNIASNKGWITLGWNALVK